MTYPKTNQTRSGTPRSASKNPTQKTGRSRGDVNAGSGHHDTTDHNHRTTSTNPVKRGGREIAGLDSRGYSRNEAARQSGAVDDVTVGPDGTRRVRKVD